MKMSHAAFLVSAALGVALVGAGTGAPAAPAKAVKVSPAVLAQGKAVVARYGCANCHGANLAGQKGFAPSLHAAGVTREYTLATWVRVLDTGVTNDGGHVKKPMPVYHMKAKDSRPLYLYVKSLN